MFGQGGKKGGFGKGKKGASWWGDSAVAKGGKTSSWSEPGPDWSATGTWRPAETEEKSGWTRRLLGRESMVKKILRPYAAGSGEVLYSNGDDLALLQKESLRKLLTADVSEISRRPAYGWSMMGNSVLALSRSLKETETVQARKQVSELLGTGTGKEFLRALSDLQYEAAKFDPATKQKSFAVVLDFLKKNKKVLYEHLSQVALAGAREYMGALQALDALIKADALKAWAQQIPDEEYLQASLDEFRQVAKPSATEAASFLVKAYKARRRQEAAWKQSGVEFRGDDSSDEADKPKRAGRKKRAPSTGSDEEPSGDSSPKRKAKKTARRKQKASKVDSEEAGPLSGESSSVSKRKFKKRKKEAKPEPLSGGEAASKPTASKRKDRDELEDGKRASAERSRKDERRKEGDRRRKASPSKKKKKRSISQKTGEDDQSMVGSEEVARKRPKRGAAKDVKSETDASEHDKKNTRKRKGAAENAGMEVEKEPAEEAANKEEERTALFTEWRQSDVQIAQAALEGLLANIGKEPGGKFEVGHLQTALALVPEVLRPPSLPDLTAEGDMMSNGAARSFVRELVSIARDVVNFYEAQQRVGSQGSAPS